MLLSSQAWTVYHISVDLLFIYLYDLILFHSDRICCIGNFIFDMDAKMIPKIKFSRQSAINTLLFTVGFNVLIGLFLTAAGIGENLTVNLILSQCIGLSICLAVYLSLWLLKPATLFMRLLLVTVAIIAGSVVGTLSGSFLTGSATTLFSASDNSFFQAILIGLLFGAVISYFFISRENLMAARALVQDERIKRLMVEKKMAESDLKRLQAQIEPHFLFNTLSTILSLLETDTTKGRAMLKDLTQYLRATLSKTRRDYADLGQEIEMITAYINIFKNRMGDRLCYSAHIPDSLKTVPFPSMLLQPLVENAIKHGLEPEISGGQIIITASEAANRLRIEITDTGRGLRATHPPGLGLANIKERLLALYDDDAHLFLEKNYPSGVKAVIEVPHASA